MNTTTIETLDFTCVDNFKDYNYPLLFNEGDDVAEGLFRVGNKEISISYHVYGNPIIEYKGEIYKNCPDDYPEELVKIIKEGNEFFHKDVNVLENSWVEITCDCVEILDMLGVDCVVLDALPDTKEQILEDMQGIIRDFIKEVKRVKGCRKNSLNESWKKLAVAMAV